MLIYPTQTQEEDGVALEHIQKKKTVRRRKKTDADDEEGDHKATRWESLSREVLPPVT